MPCITTRIDDEIEKKITESIAGSNFKNQSEFFRHCILKMLQDGSEDINTNISNLVRVATLIQRQVQTVSSPEVLLLAEIGRESISGAFKDDDGNYVKEDGKFKFRTTQRRQELVEQYFSLMNLPVVEVSR